MFSTGCATIQRVDLDDRDTVNAVHQRVYERRSTVDLRSGRSITGDIRYVTADSVSISVFGRREAVATDDVRRIVRHRDGTAWRRGALIGAGVGVGVIALVRLTAEDEPRLDTVIINSLLVAGAVPMGTLYGALLGESSGQRRIYEFRRRERALRLEE